MCVCACVCAYVCACVCACVCAFVLARACAFVLAFRAIYQAEALGLANADKHIVLASHPISDATGAELVDKADGLYAEL